MKKASVILFFLLPVLCAFRAAAADFTWLSPGARANAMGTAFSSVADDPYTVFYNPAGLSGLRNLQASAGLGRRMSPLSPVGELSLAYVRPVPDTLNRTYGFGYHGVRQSTFGRRDSLLLGVGDSFVLKYFQRPISYGASFRIVSLRDAQEAAAPAAAPLKSHLGFGFDAGLIFSSDLGLKTALTLTDMDIGLGRSLAALTLGNSYRYKDLLMALDVKARGSYSEAFFGLEQTFFNGLLQARAGKGVSLDGPGYLALGLGVNTYPWIIDFTASLPWKGLSQSAGLYELNVGYRFNVPSFNERLVGEASARMGTLKTQIDDLRQQRSALEAAIASYRVNKGVLESDLTLLQSQMRETEEVVKNLKLEQIEQEYKKNGPPKKAVIAAPPEKWPKLHKVAAGDTLRSLAGKYYGNPALWERIYEANQKFISKGLPVEGAVLEIPAPPPEK